MAPVLCSRHFGSVAAATIRNFEMEKLPLVILIAKLRGNLEIFQVTRHGKPSCLHRRIFIEQKDSLFPVGLPIWAVDEHLNYLKK